MSTMKKFEGMLFCTDLDGTLYSSDKTVSRENMDAIRYFKSEGGLFTFITGRPPCISKDMYTLIDPNAPFGCCNGAGIYDHRTQRYLWTRHLPKTAMTVARDVAGAMLDMGIQFNGEQDIFFVQDNPAMEYFRAVTHYEGTLCSLDEVTCPVLKLLFAHASEEALQALIAYLHAHPLAGEFSYVRSEKLLYEVLPKGISKGVALAEMARLLHIDPSRTVAVGDYNNDIDMVRTAGIGYAVANARPELKAVADRVTVDNDHHAIAAIIEDLDRITL